MTDRGSRRSSDAASASASVFAPGPGAQSRTDQPVDDDRPDRSGRRRPTVASADRGQTVQDFAVGASVFLLTVAFTFAFVPTFFTPFESEIAPGQESQASRVAAAIVDNGSVEDRPNWMTNETIQDAIFPGGSTDGDALQDAYGLPSISQVNVTVRPLGKDYIVNNSSGSLLPVIGSSNAPLASGDTYNGQPSATVTRIVVVEGFPECDPTLDASSEPGVQGQACRLTVRVW